MIAFVKKKTKRITLNDGRGVGVMKAQNSNYSHYFKKTRGVGVLIFEDFALRNYEMVPM